MTKFVLPQMRQQFLVLVSIVLPVAVVNADEAAYGEYLSTTCLSCHSLTDNTQALPALMTYDETSLVLTLQAYRDGSELNQTMQNVAKSLTDEDMRALAAYFAQIKE